VDSLVRDAFHRLVTLAELASISVAHRVRERFDSRRPFTRRILLRASPAWLLSAATKSIRTGPTPPTDFCNRQRAWAHRLDGSLLATEPAVSAHSAVPLNGTASGTASGADAPFARGQGRHRPAGLRVSVHDGACRGPLATTCQAPAVVRRAFPRDLVVSKQRAANLGPDRSAARTVRTFTRPKCFQPPGTLAGADPATAVRERQRHPKGACRHDPRLLRHSSPARLDRRAGEKQRR